MATLREEISASLKKVGDFIAANVPRADVTQQFSGAQLAQLRANLGIAPGRDGSLELVAWPYTDADAGIKLPPPNIGTGSIVVWVNASGTKPPANRRSQDLVWVQQPATATTGGSTGATTGGWSVTVGATTVGPLNVTPVPSTAAKVTGIENAALAVYAAHWIPYHKQLEHLIGRPINNAVVFHDAYPNWLEYSDPWYSSPSNQAEQNWTAWVAEDPANRRLICAQAMIPDPVSLPTDYLVRGANGEYAQYATALGKALVDRGLGNSVIRLGVEMNGTWNRASVPDPATDPTGAANWVKFWRATVLAMKAVNGANFLFDFNPNPATRPLDLNKYWPGDDVVDILGIDQYDQLPSTWWPNKTRYQNLVERPWSTNDLMAFAATHKKPISFPEWGVSDTANAGIGEDPEYVRQLCTSAASHPYGCAYMAYFSKFTNGIQELEKVPATCGEWINQFAGATTKPVGYNIGSGGGSTTYTPPAAASVTVTAADVVNTGTGAASTATLSTTGGTVTAQQIIMNITDAAGTYFGHNLAYDVSLTGTQTFTGAQDWTFGPGVYSYHVAYKDGLGAWHDLAPTKTYTVN